MSQGFKASISESVRTVLLKERRYLQLSETLIIPIKHTILTSKRNASSKTLHNLLHEHHTCAKGWSILIFACVSLNILKLCISFDVCVFCLFVVVVVFCCCFLLLFFCFCFFFFCFFFFFVCLFFFCCFFLLLFFFCFIIFGCMHTSSQNSMRNRFVYDGLV